MGKRHLRRVEDYYQIETQIGEGPFGSVFQAKRKSGGLTVAIKRLHGEGAWGQALQRAMSHLEKEVVFPFILHHQNIARLWEVYPAEKTFVMEFVAGETLQDHLRRKGRLTLEAALYLALQICRALEHAHEDGMIHGNLKPQNIMVQQERLVKILDFGPGQVVAQACFEEKEGKIILASPGTYEYRAPEQEERQADQKSDIYAAGLILYEMLTGQFPFERKLPRKKMCEAKLIGDIPPIWEAGGEEIKVPREVGTICMKAVRGVHKRRLGNINEIVRVLERSFWKLVIRGRLARKKEQELENEARLSIPVERIDHLLDECHKFQQLLEGLRQESNTSTTRSSTREVLPSERSHAESSRAETARRETVAVAEANVPPPPSEDNLGKRSESTTPKRATTLSGSEKESTTTPTTSVKPLLQDVVPDEQLRQKYHEALKRALEGARVTQKIRLQSRSAGPAPLTFDVQKTAELDKGVMIWVDGMVDATSYILWHDKLYEIFNEGYIHFICDWKNLRYINSTGMGVLVNLAKELEQKGGSMVVVNVHPKTMATLEMMGIHRFIKILNQEEVDKLLKLNSETSQQDSQNGDSDVAAN